MLTTITASRQPQIITKKNYLNQTFNQKKIAPLSRYIFITMLFHCYLNSSIVKIGYKELMLATGIESKATISKCLKELTEKALISKMERSTYRIWYVSKKEVKEAQEKLEIECENDKESHFHNQKSQDSTHFSNFNSEGLRYSSEGLTNNSEGLNSGSSNNELSNSTPNTPYKDNIILSRHEDTKQKDDDPLGKIKEKGSRYKYRPGSPFMGLSKAYLSNLTKKFGYKTVQDRITKLEKCYDERFDRISSAAGLLYSSLFKGQDWAFQNREDTLKEKITKERRSEEIKMEKYWLEQKQIEKQLAFQNKRLKLLEKNPVILAKCINRVKDSHPLLEESSGMFKYLLRLQLKGFKND
jgi:hypothetical protein